MEFIFLLDKDITQNPRINFVKESNFAQKLSKDIFTPFLPKNKIVLKKFFSKEQKKFKKLSKGDEMYKYVIENFGDDYEINPYYKSFLD